MKKGFTLWFTGLSGSGKSTLAQAVEKELLERGINTEILDGDVIRTNLSKGLGFSKEDRDINIRRVGFVCNLLTRNGACAIAACISPYQAIRDENREMIGRFVEVYCKAPLEALVERDVKGLYKKALAGEIKGFTGVDDPYEEPPHPEIVVETSKETVEQSVAKIIRTLELMGFIEPSQSETEYSEEEEEEIKKRLADLGYI
jgi:adenylylsulfate kinase